VTYPHDVIATSAPEEQSLRATTATEMTWAARGLGDVLPTMAGEGTGVVGGERERPVGVAAA